MLGNKGVGRGYSKIESTVNPDPAERYIEITAEAFGCGFDVRVIPPVDDEHLDAEFPDHKRARGWASGLRMTRGWRIVDRTEVDHGSD